MESKSRFAVFANRSVETALPVMCVANEYLMVSQLLHVDPWNFIRRQYVTDFGGRQYDVLELVDESTGEQAQVFFDVTGFFGRGTFTRPRADTPQPGLPQTLPEFLGREVEVAFTLEVARVAGVPMDDLTVTVKHYASDRVANWVALWRPEQNAIELAGVRRYLQNGVPLLHGYWFYRMMLEHQLQQALDRNEFSPLDTETDIRFTDHNRFIPVEESMLFTVLPEFSFVNDLLNYTFAVHKPGAFMNIYELRAFAASCQIGLQNRLFDYDELEEGVERASVHPEIEKRLIQAIRLVCQEIGIPLAPHRALHPDFEAVKSFFRSRF